MRKSRLTRSVCSKGVVKYLYFKPFPRRLIFSCLVNFKSLFVRRFERIVLIAFPQYSSAGSSSYFMSNREA